MSSVYSIKCPKCAAPLNLMGGGRVETVTCGYCGSVIDLADNYKILSTFKNTPRPDTPFKIGTKGKIRGVEYRIIGLVYYQTTYYPVGEWSDFLLFSPIYGYVWLTYEEGSIIFSRRTRDFPRLSWGEIPLNRSISLQKRAYSYHSSYDAKIAYVEGELTWVAKKDDRVSFIDIIHPPFGVSIERSGQEIEYYSSEYMDADEVYDAFEVAKDERGDGSGFNALKPFEKPMLKLLSTISMLVLMLIGLVFLGLHMDGKGKEILDVTVTNSSVTQKEFSVDSTKYLIAIEMSSPGYKDLNNFNIRVQHRGKSLFTLNRKSGFIYKENGVVDTKLSSWEYKANKVIAYIKLNKKGKYRLGISPITPSIASTIHLKIREQTSRNDYFVYFAILTFISFMLYHLYKKRYRNRLHEDSDVPNSTLISSSDMLWAALLIGILTWVIWSENYEVLMIPFIAFLVWSDWRGTWRK